MSMSDQSSRKSNAELSRLPPPTLARYLALRLEQECEDGDYAEWLYRTRIFNEIAKQYGCISYVRREKEGRLPQDLYFQQHYGNLGNFLSAGGDLACAAVEMRDALRDLASDDRHRRLPAFYFDSNPATRPHGLCRDGRPCLEHARDRTVLSCRRGRGRRAP